MHPNDRRAMIARGGQTEERRVGQLGEAALLARIRAGFARQCRTQPDGLEDDAAVIAVDRRRRRVQLATCDVLVEGTHFRGDWISPAQLGEKALTVNVSDIAAMGGAPEQCLLGLGLNGKEPADWIDELYRGIRRGLKKYGGVLVGGDTVRSKIRMLSVTLLGSFAGLPEQLPLRRRMRPGDYLYVLGYCGDSAAGLQLLRRPALRERLGAKPAAGLIRAQLRPAAQLQAGQVLARTFRRLALIDLSDDLIFSLERLADASGAGYAVELRQLAVSANLRKYCGLCKLDAFRFAAGGGEDYGLLFACAETPEQTRRKLAAALPRTRLPLRCIGRATADGRRILCAGTEIEPSTIRVFQHF